MIAYDDVKMVNCAACRQPLVAKSLAGWHRHLDSKSRKKLPPVCAGFIRDDDGHCRPYCQDCLEQEKRHRLGRAAG